MIAVKAGWRKPERNETINKGPNQDKIQSRKPEKFRWRSRIKTAENGREKIAESQEQEKEKILIAKNFTDKTEVEKVVIFDKTFQETRQDAIPGNRELIKAGNPELIIASPDPQVEKKVQ